MTPEQAQAALAEAHTTMTAEEIAQHALLLAGMLAIFDTTSQNLCDTLRNSIEMTNFLIKGERLYAALCIQVAAHFKAGQIGMARTMADQMALAALSQPPRDLLPEMPPRPLLADQCPNIFNPKAETHETA